MQFHLLLNRNYFDQFLSDMVVCLNYTCTLDCMCLVLQTLSAAGPSDWSVILTLTTAPSTPSPPSHLTMVGQITLNHSLVTLTTHMFLYTLS